MCCSHSFVEDFDDRPRTLSLWKEEANKQSLAFPFDIEVSSQLCLAAGVGYMPLKCTLRSVPAGCCVILISSVISAHEVAQAVLVPVKLVGGRKLMGRKCNMRCRVRGRGRVPGGAVLEVDPIACLRSTTRLAVMFTFSNDWVVTCNRIMTDTSLLW